METTWECAEHGRFKSDAFALMAPCPTCGNRCPEITAS